MIDDWTGLCKSNGESNRAHHRVIEPRHVPMHVNNADLIIELIFRVEG